MADVVAIGGLFSFKTQWYFYTPILAGGNSPLSIKERFMAIPDQGLGDFEEMIGELDEQLTDLCEKNEGPVVLAGQSLGALMAEELTLMGPERVKGVALIAGIHDGEEKLTVTGKAIKQLLGNPKHAPDLLRDSDMMIEHRRRREEEWPEDVPVRIYTPTSDFLIPAPDGLEVKYAHGQEATKNVVLPLMPGAHQGIREKVAHIPGIRWLRPFLPANHIDIAICPPVISDIRKLRREVATAYAEARQPELVDALTGFEPVPAAA